MGNFKIINRSAISRQTWDSLALESPDCWAWHLSAIQDAMLKWPWRTDFSFALQEEASGRLVAIVPLQLIERPIIIGLRKRKLDCFGGPAIAAGLSEKMRRQVEELLADRIRTVRDETRAWELTCSIAPMTPSVRGDSCPRVNPLLRFGLDNQVSQTWVIDLRGDEAGISRRYSESTGRKIRRASDQGYVLREAKGQEDAETYHRLHRETYRRSGLPPHPKAYFDVVFRELLPQGHCRFLFCEKDGEVIASNGMAIFKGGAYYWTGASLSEKSGTETQLLMHDQILFAKRAGCEFFDCGEAYPQAREGKLKGMSEFKRGFGGELYPLFRGRMPAATRRMRSWSAFEGMIRQMAGGAS